MFRRLRFAQPTLNAGQHAATGSATSAVRATPAGLRAINTLVVLETKPSSPCRPPLYPCAQPAAHTTPNPSIPTSTPSKLQWPESLMSSALLLENRQFFAGLRPEVHKGSPVHRLSTLLVGAVAVVPLLWQQRAVPEFPTRRLLGKKGVGCGGLVPTPQSRSSSTTIPPMSRARPRAGWPRSRSGAFTFTFTPMHGSWLNLIEGFILQAGAFGAAPYPR